MLEVRDTFARLPLMPWRFSRFGRRIGGRIVSTTGGGSDDNRTPLSRVALEVTMAMANCPKYLHVRSLVREEGPAPRRPAVQVGGPVHGKAPS